MGNKFIGIEDEVDLRRSLRAAYNHEGIIGIFTIMGELSAALKITGEMAQELLDEEEKNKGD
jgi:hypothetical protein